MSAEQIECPKCTYRFTLSESMQKKIRAELEADFAERKEALEAELVEKAKRNGDRIRAQAEKDVRAELAASTQALTQDLEIERARVQEAKQRELQLRRDRSMLEQEKSDLELEVTRKIDEERTRIRTEVESKVSDRYSMKEQEWAKQRSDMAKQIEELRRKAEQGSQQTQGEVLELEVESTIKDLFPSDEVEPVAKGIRGGDILQKVQTQGGVYTGSILLELKRTKAWSDGWLQKVRDDQREAKADVAVIITAMLPKGVKHLGLVDGVWVASFETCFGLIAVLRSGLFELTKARAAAAGRKDKAVAVYDYLNGNEFRGRVEQIVEALVEMGEDLASEKRALEKAWSKREKQLARAVGGMAGMYGDMQGQIGSLPDIKILALE